MKAHTFHPIINPNTSTEDLCRLLAQASEGVLDSQTLGRTIAFAMGAHRNHRRKSGEPYIHHPLHVAIWTAQAEGDAVAIQSSLLHDVAEMNPGRGEALKKIRGCFGSEVANLVQSLTKPDGGTWLGSLRAEMAYWRQIRLAAEKDGRVLLVKSADLAHNLQTISHLSVRRRWRYWVITRCVYLPLVRRREIQWAEWLERCLQVYSPSHWGNAFG